MENLSHIDPIARDEWHVVASIEELPSTGMFSTVLLGQKISIGRHGDRLGAWCEPQAAAEPSGSQVFGAELPVIQRFGYLWATLGDPPRDLFEIPEFDEPDRSRIVQGVTRVGVSAPRAVENFLDMGHFPFVHTGILGEEPHTEVKPYKVDVYSDPPEILVTDCEFYQPQANAGSETGADTEYVYRIPIRFVPFFTRRDRRARIGATLSRFSANPSAKTRCSCILLSVCSTKSRMWPRCAAFTRLFSARTSPFLKTRCPSACRWTRARRFRSAPTPPLQPIVDGFVKGAFATVSSQVAHDDWCRRQTAQA